eukprot:333871_1
MFTTWKPVKVSIKNQNKLIEAIRTAKQNGGVIIVEDTGTFNMHTISRMFDSIDKKPELVQRANKAYSRNLVYKDVARYSPNKLIDQKRALDLSEERLKIINKCDKSLINELGDELKYNLQTFRTVSKQVVPEILSAISKAINIQYDVSKVNYNYRMIDYFHDSTKPNHGPKCNEHKDFGIFTLIFQDTVGGLQIQKDNVWHNIITNDNEAVLLFGWCAQIASNDRIIASNHRVVGVGKRRNSAVLFVAPNPDHVLRPMNDMQANYKSVSVSELKERMRNAWKVREGTSATNNFDTKMNFSQDAVVNDLKL